MTNYRRRTEQIIIPYPYLTETTDLAVSGISNSSRSPPATLANNQWYTVPTNTTVTVASDTVIVIVRDIGNVQRLFWEEAGSTGTTENVVEGDHFVLVPNGLPVITIAGFDLMALGDRTNANTNNGLIQFPTNIKFRFTESN